jgi:hypothetical protein
MFVAMELRTITDAYETTARTTAFLSRAVV